MARRRNPLRALPDRIELAPGVSATTPTDRQLDLLIRDFPALITALEDEYGPRMLTAADTMARAAWAECGNTDPDDEQMRQVLDVIAARNATVPLHDLFSDVWLLLTLPEPFPQYAGVPGTVALQASTVVNIQTRTGFPMPQVHLENGGVGPKYLTPADLATVTSWEHVEPDAARRMNNGWLHSHGVRA